MNAFEKGSLTREDFIPYKIVSLWDMENFYADKFMDISGCLTRISEIVRIHRDSGIELSPFDKTDEMTEWLRGLSVDLRAVGLDLSLMASERLLVYIKEPEGAKFIDGLKCRVDDLNQRIMDELTTKSIMLLDSSSTSFYNKVGTFLGDEVISKLSELQRDAVEAGNCYALGRYTACVFHLMRIMERLVQSFATFVNAKNADGSALDIRNEDWYIIEQAIARQLTNMSRGEPKEKRNRCLTSLAAVRAGWRNKTMHPGPAYSKEEAQSLLGVVELFVKDYLSMTDGENIQLVSIDR